MHLNHSNDEQTIKQLDRALESGAPSGIPIADQLAQSAPQANPRFQQQLEARLVAQLEARSARHGTGRRLPLTLVAAMFALVIAGGLLIVRISVSSGSSGEASYAALHTEQADFQQTQTALEAVVTQQAALISALQNRLTRLEEAGFAIGGVVTAVDSPRALDAVHRSGMRWVQLQVAYPQTVAEVRRSIDTAHQNGLRLLITAVGDPSRLDDGQYVRGYIGWLADLASAGVDAIQVWREPNLDRLWPSHKLAGENYVELLRQAYAAIKTASPTTMVISAAPAPTGAEAAFPGQVLNDDRWLRQVVTSGGLEALDCVGVQYNEGIVAPDVISGDPRDNYYTRFLGAMYAAYTEIIGSEVPLCFTELGYLSPEGYPALPAFFAWASEVSIADQAEWLGRAIELLWQVGQVRLVIIWNVDFTSYGDDPQAGYAMIRADGSCPACDRVRVAIDYIAAQEQAAAAAPTLVPTPKPAHAGTPASDLPECETYTVREGDTLISIAYAYHVGVPLLARVNGLDAPLIVRPAVGETLMIPAPGCSVESQGVVTGVEGTQAALQPVVIALRDLPRGTQITEDMLAVVYWPESSFLPLSHASIDMLAGLHTTVRIPRWQPVLADQVAARNQSPADHYPLPQGKVAVAIPVKNLVVLSVMFLPGDRVNIVAPVLVRDGTAAEQRPVLREEAILPDDPDKLPEVIAVLGSGIDGLMIVAVDPADAELLTGLIDSQVPLTLTKADPS